MRAGFSVSIIGLLCGCRPPAPAALETSPGPTFIVGVEGQAVTVNLPRAAYLTIFAVDALGRITVVSPVSPPGRMSFGPLPDGRRRLQLAQAVLWVPGIAGTLAPNSPAIAISDESQVCRALATGGGMPQSICSPAGSPAGRAGVSAWSLEDWALLVVAASPDPLSVGQVRQALSQARNPGQAGRSADERKAVQAEVAGRLIAAVQAEGRLVQIATRQPHR